MDKTDTDIFLQDNLKNFRVVAVYQFIRKEMMGSKNLLLY